MGLASLFFIVTVATRARLAWVETCPLPCAGLTVEPSADGVCRKVRDACRKSSISLLDAACPELSVVLKPLLEPRAPACWHTCINVQSAQFKAGLIDLQ
ncbi:hypothetical protein FQA47_020824 [Oryzias melastigma]|uniref:FZ domain-containing protein n=1 Tax=Oryzias melastigma TaxID=30732 RepID=A0A834CM10_ORYME|nr:hypothetical protein FQA47_020824 [Oryzias melastigma]